MVHLLEQDSAMQIINKYNFLIIIGLCFFNLLSTATVHADDNTQDGAILSGKDYAYIVATPDGWKMISVTFADAVFHPIVFPYKTTPVIIYVRSATKSELGITNIEQLNALDLAEMKKKSPKLISKKIGYLKTKDESEIPVYSFEGGKFIEAVAYANQEKTITVFVLSAETRKAYDDSYKAFVDIVGSYFFITDIVSDDTKAD